MENKKYWYEYLHQRGFGIGCQPDGFIDRDSSKGRYGSVAYSRKLTKDEAYNYDLKFLKESKK